MTEMNINQANESGRKINPVLAPVTRNYLRINDKVRMIDGRILTVKSLEFKEFVSIEEIGYIKKKDIDTILE